MSEILEKLIIENAAVIERAELELTDGFTVLTGETGAGKSIIIDSLNALTGERISKELVRTGAKQASFCAVFSSPGERIRRKAEEYGISLEEDGDAQQLILSRTVTADGRSSCRINGLPVTVAMLRSIGSMLVNIHGQHDSQSLLNGAEHIRYLDMLCDNAELLDRYREKYNEMITVQKRLDALCATEQERENRLDYLRFLSSELEAAAITPGEVQELTQLKKRYKNYEHIQSLLHQSRAVLNGDGEMPGAIELVYAAIESLTQLQRYFPDIGQTVQEASQTVYALEECADAVTRCDGESDIDSIDIDEVEQRLDILSRLMRKYGADEQELLEKLQEIRNECEKLQNSDQELTNLTGKLEKLKKEVYNLGRELSALRMQTGQQFSQAVAAHLASLNMPDVKLCVHAVEIPPCADGIDSIRFLISPNPGEEPKELNKIASGGELSRIMLAFKSVLAGFDEVQTMVFDEIDTGVSGSAAGKMAKKMRDIARDGRQVICVTHLAKIACYACSHFLIAKSTHDGVTKTAVRQLDMQGRVAEIARMTGGEELTKTALDNAREMITLAGSEK